MSGIFLVRPYTLSRCPERVPVRQGHRRWLGRMCLRTIPLIHPHRLRSCLVPSVPTPTGLLPHRSPSHHLKLLPCCENPMIYHHRAITDYAEHSSHPAVDLQAIQHKMEGSLSQVGINLGAIWRHIVETTTLETAKHRSDALRWKERCLHFEEMYKNCKQKLDNMNHDNIMLQTQIGRFQAELTRVRGQGRPVGPPPQMMRHHGAFPNKGQDHVGHGMTLSSICSCFLTTV